MADTKKRSSPARRLEYPWSMARTLFDDSDATRHDEGVASSRRRVAIGPVRLTKGERDQLADVARDLGLSISTYMRQVVLSRPLPRRRAVRPIPEVNRETYQDLPRPGQARRRPQRHDALHDGAPAGTAFARGARSPGTRSPFRGVRASRGSRDDAQSGRR